MEYLYFTAAKPFLSSFIYAYISLFILIVAIVKISVSSAMIFSQCFLEKMILRLGSVVQSQ